MIFLMRVQSFNIVCLLVFHNLYIVHTMKYTRALVVRPSFWFGPHVFTAYANKNPLSLSKFQADKRWKIFKKFRLKDHKCKWSKTLCQILSFMINLSMFYATKTMEQWGPNHEYVALWRDITTFFTLTRHFSATTRLNLTISSTNVKEIFSDLMV